jgi:hypothetical protein
MSLPCTTTFRTTAAIPGNNSSSGENHDYHYTGHVPHKLVRRTRVATGAKIGKRRRRATQRLLRTIRDGGKKATVSALRSCQNFTSFRAQSAVRACKENFKLLYLRNLN